MRFQSRLGLIAFRLMGYEEKMGALRDEVNGDLHHHLHHPSSAIIKGKRTKRPRQSSPACVAVSAASTSSTDSDEMPMISSEEEEVADCLILLSQGIDCERKEKEKDAGTGGSGSDGYECKTCNRMFMSFQALGGHRASHKKPKLSLDGHDYTQKVLEIGGEREVELKVNKMSSTQSNNKIHECSICGAGFSSGQALGGHMRRHRSPAVPNLSLPANDLEDEQKRKKKKQRNVLELDLNLPAPVEDDKFQYSSTKILFSGPTLVGCQY